MRRTKRRFSELAAKVKRAKASGVKQRPVKWTTQTQTSNYFDAEAPAATEPIFPRHKWMPTNKDEWQSEDYVFSASRWKQLK